MPEQLAEGWAHQLADAMADAMAHQLQPPQGALAGFSSGPSPIGSLPPVMPELQDVAGEAGGLMGPEAPMPQELEPLVDVWAHELADEPPLQQLEELRPPLRGVLVPFGSEAEWRAQVPAMLPYGERQKAEQQRKQQLLQHRQQGGASKRKQQHGFVL